MMNGRKAPAIVRTPEQQARIDKARMQGEYFTNARDILVNEGVTLAKITNIEGLSVWIVWDSCHDGSIKHYDSFDKFKRAIEKISMRYV